MDILDNDWLMAIGFGQDQWKLLFSLESVIYGSIFPWLRDTRAFLLLNRILEFRHISNKESHDFSHAIWNK